MQAILEGSKPVQKQGWSQTSLKIDCPNQLSLWKEVWGERSCSLCARKEKKPWQWLEKKQIGLRSWNYGGAEMGAIWGAGLEPWASPNGVSRGLRAPGPSPTPDLESPCNSALFLPQPRHPSGPCYFGFPFYRKL